MNKPDQPIKQFYNRKTKKWHVYYPNPKEGKPAQVIKETRYEKLPHVPVVGSGKPAEKTDFTLVADSLYKQPQNENEQPENQSTDYKTVEQVSGKATADKATDTAKNQPEEKSTENESDELGFFNFL